MVPDSKISITMVDACLRDGGGGSPTAVLFDDDFSERERRRIPVAAGTSHAVFVTPRGPGRTGLRFFTATGELPACGHGTVAALAFLAAGAAPVDRRSGWTLDSGGREFTGLVTRHGDLWRSGFDPGRIELRPATPLERELVLPVLGAEPGLIGSEITVASIGRARLLVPIVSRAALLGLTPELERLREVCEQLGLLGCYVYTRAATPEPLAARMFAPAIGVDEDIANANSTACLAALLATTRTGPIAVEMGDSIGHPATITGTIENSIVIVGGDARVGAVRTIDAAN